jgi:hypothetical protein
MSPVGFVRLDYEWREKQPNMLEFAVTTVGLAFELLSPHRFWAYLHHKTSRLYTESLYKGSSS